MSTPSKAAASPKAAVRASCTQAQPARVRSRVAAVASRDACRAAALTRDAACQVAPGSNPLGSAGLSAVMGYACATLFKTLASGVLVVFAATLALLKARSRFRFGFRPVRKTVCVPLTLPLARLSQWMELQGMLTINWPAIHSWLGAKAQLLDQNGDGKLDKKDVHALASRFATVMATTAPSAAGFVGGFAFGMM